MTSLNLSSLSVVPDSGDAEGCERGLVDSQAAHPSSWHPSRRLRLLGRTGDVRVRPAEPSPRDNVVSLVRMEERQSRP